MSNPECGSASATIPQAEEAISSCVAIAHVARPLGRNLPAGRPAKLRLSTVVVLAALITACAPKTRLGPLDPSHPASPDAPEAVVREPAAVLQGSSVGGG